MTPCAINANSRYYNPATKQHTAVPNTLFNEVSSLICDQRGRVWIGTEEKLFSYLIKEKKFILFGEPDGVVQNEYLEKPRLLTSSGDIYMGGVNGLLHINRHLPKEPSLFPTLQLADILVGGERVYERISNDHQLSVNDITDKTGFSTARYFSTVFKQHTGCSPLNTKRKETKSRMIFAARCRNRNEIVVSLTRNN